MAEILICSGDECIICTHCSAIDDNNKAKVKIYCAAKEKWYWYGQYINCDNFKRKTDM